MVYKKASDKFTEEFFKLVEQAKYICITSHTSPDGDSISSMLTVYRLISAIYPDKKIRMIQTSRAIKKYGFFENFSSIEFVPDLVDSCGNCDLFIFLDGNRYGRFTYKPEELRSLAKKSISIDHHRTPVEDFTLTLVDVESSSTSEILYTCFYKNKEIDKSLAETLLLGILTDTGNLKYIDYSQTETLLITKRLVEIAKMNIQEFLSRFDVFSKRVFILVQELIKNSEFRELAGWPPFQISFIDEDFMKSEKYKDEEITESARFCLGGFIRLIEGYTWGFVITPKENGNSDISLRSLPASVNVREMMERMGIGGGHNRAAGGTFTKYDGISVLKCIKQTLEWMSKNKPVID